MAKRRILISLVVWLSLANCPAHGQGVTLPNPSEYLQAVQFNAFGKRPSTADLQFNAFTGDLPYDNSVHAAVKAGIRDQKWLGPRLQVDYGYLLLFIQPADVPALLTTTTGSLAVENGALGQPNTVVLDSGERVYDAASAFRIQTIWTLVDQIEVVTSAFISEQKANIVDVNSDAAGSPFLARPFFNPAQGIQDSDPRAVPNAQQALTHAAMTARVMGVDSVLRWSEAQRYDGPVWSIFGGFSFLRFDERLYIADFVRELPAGTGSTFLFSDSFSTSNRLYGAQFGAQLDWCFPDALFTIFGKLTLGPTEQFLTISGLTTETQANGTFQEDTNQGLYAQPTNVGTYHRWKFGAVPEIGASAAYQLTPRIRASLGYTFKYFVNAVRPADQINPIVNLQPLFDPVITPPFQPQFTGMKSSAVWIQYLDFGLQFLF